jgi:non-canonical purine NTP pyrophosphatase (RdgB/HAM1 family)
MKEIIFITGNQNKADYLAKYLGYPIKHLKLDLVEIQSMDLGEIVEHKVREAYALVQKPVLVEDVSLEMTGLHGLPGPFIKHFEQRLSFEQMCEMVRDRDRTAVGRAMYGYFDGQHVKVFEGVIHGRIADQPAGDKGFGWDKIFIPEGYDVTRACLSDEDYQIVYMQIRPFSALKRFLDGLASPAALSKSDLLGG